MRKRTEGANLWYHFFTSTLPHNLPPHPSTPPAGLLLLSDNDIQSKLLPSRSLPDLTSQPKQHQLSLALQQHWIETIIIFMSRQNCWWSTKKLVWLSCICTSNICVCVENKQERPVLVRECINSPTYHWTCLPRVIWIVSPPCVLDWCLT